MTPLHAPICDMTPARNPTPLGLRSAIVRLIGEMERAYGPEIELCDDLADMDVRPALLMPVLCILHELLLNACHHSRSKRFLVGIGQDNTQVYIQVQDWGIGFNSAKIPPHGRGLKTVCQLVHCLGGTVDIDSQPGSGTCIAVELPLPDEDR